MTVESISVTASFEWLVRGDSSLVVMTGLDTSGCNEFRWRRCWPAKRFDESADLDGGGEQKIRSVGEELCAWGPCGC